LKLTDKTKVLDEREHSYQVLLASKKSTSSIGRGCFFCKLSNSSGGTGIGIPFSYVSLLDVFGSMIWRKETKILCVLANYKKSK